MSQEETKPSVPVVMETHIGTCHCQDIRFTVTIPPITEGGTCDCSHCHKRGIIWGFCETSNFKLERGRESLKEYEFGAKSFKLLSCGKCATFIAGGKSAATFPEGESSIGFNIRALRDINIHDVPIKQYTGSERTPAYEPAAAIDHHFKAGNGKVILHGSCHCQNVKFVVETRPLGEAGKNDKGELVEVLDCNCSICGGNGLLWMYPKHEEYFFSPESADHLVPYAYTPDSPTQNQFFSCKTCGCGVFEKRIVSTGIGLNIRLLEGVDLSSAGVAKDDALSWEPLYTLRE